jgi:hypothetical protein
VTIRRHDVEWHALDLEFDEERGADVGMLAIRQNCISPGWICTIGFSWPLIEMIAPDVSLWTIYKGVTPFEVADLIKSPAITLGLPATMHQVTQERDRGSESIYFLFCRSDSLLCQLMP